MSVQNAKKFHSDLAVGELEDTKQGLTLECANCRLEQELPDNVSMFRLIDISTAFHESHKTRIGNAWCKKANLFIRTVK